MMLVKKKQLDGLSNFINEIDNVQQLEIFDIPFDCKKPRRIFTLKRASLIFHKNFTDFLRMMSSKPIVRCRGKTKTLYCSARVKPGETFTKKISQKITKIFSQKNLLIFCLAFFRLWGGFRRSKRRD